MFFVISNSILKPKENRNTGKKIELLQLETFAVY